MMKFVLVFALVASFFAENLLLPVGKERQREDMVTRCLVEVLSKALTKPDSHPLDQECKDILKAGARHTAPLEKKRDEEVLSHEEEVKGHEPEPEIPGADVKDSEARLRSTEEKRETPENEERSLESWNLNDEKEKRVWKPTHRYHHKEVSEEKREEPDEERSQESWSLGDEKETRYRPTYRYTLKKPHKRDDKNEECSQESWDLNDDEMEKRAEEEKEREKRNWKPTRRYHHKKHHKRGADSSDEESEEKRSESEEEEEREKRIWKPTNRYHHNKHHQRSGDSSEEEEEEQRSDSDEHEGKRHGDAKEEREGERQEALRYLAEKRSEVESRLLAEGKIYEKRSPWAYRGYYHPAWWKRSIEPHTPSDKMEELAKLLKRHQLASQSEPVEERSVPLTLEEEKELQNLAAMDKELQKIAEKMHENRSK